MKICSNKKCSLNGISQSLDQYFKDPKAKDKLGTWCKTCVYALNKEYSKTHRKQLSEKARLRRAANREKVRERKRKYDRTHKEQKAECDKRYRERHREDINKHLKQRRQEDVEYKISISLRNRLYDAIKNDYKSGSAVADLMMSISDFKKYLEERWYPNPETGEMMSWENYGRKNGHLGWDIDHIIPLSAFDLTDREQLLKAVHYSNLRPMWAKQNMSENDRGMSRRRKNATQQF